jgi:hypothetical protein
VKGIVKELVKKEVGIGKTINVNRETEKEVAIV